jgi:hypothetical protein
MSSEKLRMRPLTIREILDWADAYREATGRWPSKAGGRIVGSKFETWARVDNALRVGLRGLTGGSSLAQLLAQERGARNISNLPSLTEAQILQWADELHGKSGSWPRRDSGVIGGAPEELWQSIDVALRKGLRSLPGKSSLAILLAEHRGVRNRKRLTPFTEELILRWVDSHHARTGSWPTAESGSILEAPDETWMAVDMALRNGVRGMPGGYTLALLLAERRQVRNIWSISNLSMDQILGWADAFHERTGEWPTLLSGPIIESPGDTWCAVNQALKSGTRGLLGGCSLAALIASQRGVRNRRGIPNLTRKQILAWADAYHRRSGNWPTRQSGSVSESPEETWAALDAALHFGNRGLRGGSSLAQLFAQYRGKRDSRALPLSKRKILSWADLHYQRIGQWPNVSSGPVVDAPGEHWKVIDTALRVGGRGLAGGLSLVELLVRKRGARNRLRPPPLNEAQILQWAQYHFESTQSWPTRRSGPVIGAIGETWAGVNLALLHGKRTLPGGSSLAKLLSAHRSDCVPQ